MTPDPFRRIIMQLTSLLCDPPQRTFNDYARHDTMNLEEYLRDNIAKNVIDHQLRARIDDSSGDVVFYLHPANMDGETLDFAVRGNVLGQIEFGPVE